VRFCSSTRVIFPPTTLVRRKEVPKGLLICVGSRLLPATSASVGVKRRAFAFSNVRRARARQTTVPPRPMNSRDADDDAARDMRSFWARLIKKVYEADPLMVRFSFI
jgi:hypothetical protein